MGQNSSADWVFSDSLCLYCIKCHTCILYDPFSTTKIPLSTKNSLATPIFLLSSNFRAHPTTLLLKILGGPMHRPSPTSNFGGNVPHIGLRLWRKPISSTSARPLRSADRLDLFVP